MSEEIEEAVPMSAVKEGTDATWAAQHLASKDLDKETNVLPVAGSETAAAIASGELKPETPANTEADSTVANVIPAANQESSETKPKDASSSTSNFEGTDLYDAITSFTNFSFIESTIFSDGSSRKIDCFLVDKSVMDKSGCLHYIYGKEVSSINISQSMSSYGITGSVDISDTFGTVSSILDKQNNFYFVIAILDVGKEDKEGNCSGYFIQPYVFEIDRVSLKSSDGKPTKVYHLVLSDIISATLKKVGYGNLLLQYPEFINSNHFGEIYATIFDYAAQIIYLLHNKKFHVKNSIEFIDDINESSNDLIKNVILKDLQLNMSCYDLLNHIYKHSAREVKIPSHFKGDNPGNVLVPLFIQDEIEDTSNTYRTFFNKEVKQKILEPMAFTGGPFSVNAHCIRRSLYGRTLIMPFELAFAAEGPSYIYENINPITDKMGNLVSSELIYNSMNGIVFSPLEDTVDIPPPGEITGLGWKNLALISDGPEGPGNLLIYFNWIYEYYKAAFLNTEESFLKKQLKTNFAPVSNPHFNVMDTAGLADGDKETFAKMNANTIILKSNEQLKEALFHVGRALKSFIFLNSLSGFKIKGNTLRHPGEIIKITNPSREMDDFTPVAPVGGLDGSANGMVLMYMTSVSHIFDNNKFNDLIYATKICTLSGESKANTKDNGKLFEKIQKPETKTA